MSDHTPGLLSFRHDFMALYSASGKSIANVNMASRSPVSCMVDGERLRDCWNACAEMDDPVAEIARLQAEDHPGPDEKLRILIKLQDQRDELLSAAELALDELEKHERRSGECNGAATALRDAIAKAGAA